MKKTIKAKSGHTLFVKSIDFQDLPTPIKENNAEKYTKFYVVKNWDDNGAVFMYLGKGYAAAPKEVVVWYRNGGFWSSFGKNIEEAINGAQRDGWLYA